MARFLHNSHFIVTMVKNLLRIIFIVSAHEKPKGMNVEKTNDNKR